MGVAQSDFSTNFYLSKPRDVPASADLDKALVRTYAQTKHSTI
jgi:hypothetical protein